jgi:hypothetical protein
MGFSMYEGIPIAGWFIVYIGKSYYKWMIGGYHGVPLFRETSLYGLLLKVMDEVQTSLSDIIGDIGVYPSENQLSCRVIHTCPFPINLI